MTLPRLRLEMLTPQPDAPPSKVEEVKVRLSEPRLSIHSALPEASVATSALPPICVPVLRETQTAVVPWT